MAAKVPTVQLRSGARMPQLGLGTSSIGALLTKGRPSSGEAMKEEACGALNAALEAGYRLIDTATMYNNEQVIGEVLAQWLGSGRLTRDQLFITTKLPNNANRKEDVPKFLKRSLEKLQLTYVDLYLIHNPVGTISDDDDVAYPVDSDGNLIIDTSTNLEQIWAAMEEQVDAGRAKDIGFSCFNSKQIERILKVARIPPSNLQIEVHGYLQQGQLRGFCAARGISVCGFQPLGAPHRNPGTKETPKLVEHPTVAGIARRLGRTPAQVLLRHLIQHGVIVIPKSSNPQRLRENIQVFDFELTAEDMKAMDNLDIGPESRICSLRYLRGAENHPEFPYNLPF